MELTHSDHRLAGVKDYPCYSFKNFIYLNLFFTDFTLTRLGTRSVPKVFKFSLKLKIIVIS